MKKVAKDSNQLEEIRDETNFQGEFCHKRKEKTELKLIESEETFIGDTLY